MQVLEGAVVFADRAETKALSRKRIARLLPRSASEGGQANCVCGGAAMEQQFSVWPLPPEGGTTNGRRPGEKPFVVPASAGPNNPFQAILRIAALRKGRCAAWGILEEETRLFGYGVRWKAPSVTCRWAGRSRK